MVWLNEFLKMVLLISFHIYFYIMYDGNIFIASAKNNRKLL